MNTKKIVGIAAVTLLVAVALVGAGAAAEEPQIGENSHFQELNGTTTVAYYDTFAAAVTGVTNGNTLKLIKGGSENLLDNLSISKKFTVTNAEGTTPQYVVNLNGNQIEIAAAAKVNFGTEINDTVDPYTYTGLKFYDAAWTQAKIAMTVGNDAEINQMYLSLENPAKVSGSERFVSVTGAATIHDSLFNFSGITNESTHTVLGIYLSGTGDVLLDSFGILNANSELHKSQSIICGKTTGTVTIQDCSLVDGVQAGTSVDDRESVCVRIVSQDAGDAGKITIKNSTLYSNASKTNVGIAIDAQGDAIKEGSIVELDGVEFSLGEYGFEIWKEQSSKSTKVNVVGDGIVCLDEDLYIGMRQGETAGLSVGAIDFDFSGVTTGGFKPVTGILYIGESGHAGSALDCTTLANSMTTASDVSKVIGKNIDAILGDDVEITNGNNIEVPSDVKLTTNKTVAGVSIDSKIKVTGGLTVNGEFDGTIASGSAGTITVGENAKAEVTLENEDDDVKIALGNGATLTTSSLWEDIKDKITYAAADTKIVVPSGTVSFTEAYDKATSGDIDNYVSDDPTKETQVSLTVATSYEFTIPATAELKSTINGIAVYDIGITATSVSSGQTLKLKLRSTAAEEQTKFSMLDKDEQDSGARFQIGTWDETTSTFTAVKDYTTTLEDGNVLLSLDMSPTSTSATGKMGFKTITLPTKKGTSVATVAFYIEPAVTA